MWLADGLVGCLCSSFALSTYMCSLQVTVSGDRLPSLPTFGGSFYQNCFHSRISILSLNMVSVMSFSLSLSLFSPSVSFTLCPVESQNSTDALLLSYLLMNPMPFIPSDRLSQPVTSSAVSPPSPSTGPHPGERSSSPCGIFVIWSLFFL